MVSLDWDVKRQGGVTLVELVVHSEVGARVRLDSNLAPVWPPRVQGVPAAGWSESGFEGTVAAGSRLVLGYASPAEPVDPPVDLATVEEPTTSDGGKAVTPEAIVRALGEASPPRDVVTSSNSRGRRSERSAVESTETGTAGIGTARRETVEPDQVGTEEWLVDVEERVGAAERLSEASSVEEARDAIAGVGGLGAVRRLRDRLRADRQHLTRTRERATELEERLAAVDVPLETLARLR